MQPPAEKPIDLFKAIFEDDSDDSDSEQDDPEPKANTLATTGKEQQPLAAVSKEANGLTGRVAHPAQMPIAFPAQVHTSVARIV